MLELLFKNVDSISQLGAVGLLVILVLVVCFFYRRDFLKELKASQEERHRCSDIQQALMSLVKTDIQSRDKNSDAHVRLSTSIEGLTQYLKGKLD